MAARLHSSQSSPSCKSRHPPSEPKRSRGDLKLSPPQKFLLVNGLDPKQVATAGLFVLGQGGSELWQDLVVKVNIRNYVISCRSAQGLFAYLCLWSIVLTISFSTPSFAYFSSTSREPSVLILSTTTISKMNQFEKGCFEASLQSIPIVVMGHADAVLWTA